ncbi:MAG: calcineurin-like phosphoesterase family protein [Tannerellaceae bacterium]
MKRTMTFVWLTLLFFLCYGELQAQVDLRNQFVSGKVKDAVSGSGIPDVSVSDGYTVVQTDAEGNYQLVTNRTATFVMLTVPSAYEIPMSEGLPSIAKRIETVPEKQELNFELRPLKTSEYNHQTIVFADPQVYNDSDMEKFAYAVSDMRETICKEKNNSYLMVCGDIVFDQPKLFAGYKEIIRSLGRPVFHAKGNHDMSLGGWSMESSADRFRTEFGPEYYSYNRGEVHYVVLDDVMYTARDYLYIGYLSGRQMNWLKQDLERVKVGSTVVVMFHIPAWSLENKLEPTMRGSFLDCLQNRKHLFELLQPFRAHIFSGHNHCNENYLLADNLMEHIHGGLCGSWWQADFCTDGSPAGYAVYTVSGGELSWQYKSTGRALDDQVAVYPIGIDSARPQAFVANVWNWDPEWKVCWYEDDKPMGEMTQYVGFDPFVTAYFEANRAGWIHTWIHSTKTEHLFYAVPSSSATTVRVEATDRFGRTYSKCFFAV